MVINESISISQTPETIWNFWIDVTNDVQWRDGITKAKWTSPPPYGIGSTGEHYHKDLGATNWEITSFEDGRCFEFIHTEGKLKGSIAVFQVEPENRGSRVTVNLKITVPFFIRFMMLFVGNIMSKGIQADLQMLKELMEKQVTNA